MKIEISKDWCVRMAQLESNEDEIGAGPLAVGMVLDEETSPHRDAFNFHDSNFAFGRLVRLMRRKGGFTIDTLAEAASIDIEELIEIETVTHYRPEVRTVYQLANVFGLARSNLLKVAGLIEAQNDVLYKEAIRFAASSEPVEALTSQERAALEAFVAVLNKT